MRARLHRLLRWLLPILAGASAGSFAAAQPFSAQIEAARGRLKVFTTSTLPTSCAIGTVVFDSTANIVKLCADGVNWVPTTSAAQAGTGTGTLSVGGVICKDAPNTSTTGTGEEVLATCTIPANTLTTNGQMIRVTFFAHTAANTNNKTLNIKIGGLGGTSIVSTGSRAANNQNIALLHPAVIQRLSATTGAGQGWTYNSPDGVNQAGTAHGQSSVRAVSVTWANSTTIVITGITPSLAGDLTLDAWTVEVVQ